MEAVFRWIVKTTDMILFAIRWKVWIWWWTLLMLGWLSKWKRIIEFRSGLLFQIYSGKVLNSSPISIRLKESQYNDYIDMPKPSKSSGDTKFARISQNTTKDYSSMQLQVSNLLSSWAKLQIYQEIKSARNSQHIDIVT